MAEMETLQVTKRSETGKGPNRRLRANGEIPGIFYNSEGENIAVQTKEIPFIKAYRKIGSNSVFTLQIDDNGSSKDVPSLVWKLHHHPVRNQIIHIDFFGVDLKKEVKVIIPVETTGNPKGVVVGGVLELYRDSIEIICLPMDIPEKIEVDVAELEIGQYISVQSIEMPEGVRSASDENFAVVGVNTPRAVDELEEGEEEEGTEEEAAAE